MVKKKSPVVHVYLAIPILILTRPLYEWVHCIGICRKNKCFSILVTVTFTSSNPRILTLINVNTFLKWNLPVMYNDQNQIQMVQKCVSASVQARIMHDARCMSFICDLDPQQCKCSSVNLQSIFCSVHSFLYVVYHTSWSQLFMAQCENLLLNDTSFVFVLFLLLPIYFCALCAGGIW